MGSQNYIYDESKLKHVNFITKEINKPNKYNNYTYKEDKKRNLVNFIK